MRSLALILLAILSKPSLSATLPTVMTCSAATAGALMTPWPNCASPVYVAAGPGLIVAIQRNGISQWQPSTAILATDAVFTSAFYTGTTSDWWPASSFQWGSSVPLIATITFKWAAPTTNADGSTPMLPLAKYNIYEGSAANSLSVYAAITSLVLTYTTPSLPAGTYYFSITAVGQNGAESLQSPVITETISAAPPKPLAPATPSAVVGTVN